MQYNISNSYQYHFLWKYSYLADLLKEKEPLELISGTGLVAQARQVLSPNFDARPVNCFPELIVIHNISMPPYEFGGDGIDQLFTNCLSPADHPYYSEIGGLKVSSHFLIRRDGGLVQYVDIFSRAWHAGISLYKGREQCNDFSVGIELEGADDVPYELMQYHMLAELITMLRNSVPTLRLAPFVGHSEIAPGRKTDPGPEFKWDTLESFLD
jgi:N-acetyl-anhydromuramoyl-L-alanine amidase